MQLPNEILIAKNLVADLLSSRRSRRRLARLLPTIDGPPSGSIRILVYFADAEVNLYQIRQWYAPLAELQSTWPVAIVSRSPQAAERLLAESPVPVVYLRQVVELEQFLETQDIRIVLYVNQNPRNFQMMRYARMWHVFINHGESDKMYMTTNQFKAYDYSLVAGRAAIERLTRKLWDFDIDRRVIEIGRPQNDHLGGVLPYTPDERIVVLYAPTWEGDRGSARYGSVASHGVALATALLASDRHRLVYRPHPRTGVVDPAFRQADDAIRAAIAMANTRDPAAQHVFDDTSAIGWQLQAPDVAITDVSAMVYDRLATGRPLVVTRPASAEAEVDESGYLGSAEWLTAEEAGDVIRVVDRALGSESKERLAFWVDHHFGDTTQGSATARFRAAIGRLMEEWDRHAALHPSDPR